jgi:hypothetical protein
VVLQCLASICLFLGAHRDPHISWLILRRYFTFSLAAKRIYPACHDQDLNVQVSLERL